MKYVRVIVVPDDINIKSHVLIFQLIVSIKALQHAHISS